MNRVDICKLVDLPKISDPKGSLSFVQNKDIIPFDIKRIYYLYDIKSCATRGEHAHKQLEQLMIPINGSFTVELDDGFTKKVIVLDRPYKGLYICPMIWRKLDKFSKDAVCLVLASELYDESDYYRNYQDFLKDVK